MNHLLLFLCFNSPLVFINVVSSLCIYCVSSPVCFYSLLAVEVLARISFLLIVGVGNVDRELASQLLVMAASAACCKNRNALIKLRLCMSGAFCASVLLSIVYLNLMKRHQYASFQS